MSDVTLAAALPGLVEALKITGPTVAVLIGFGMLRRQEQVKRQEEVAAGVRRLQLEALADVVEAIGRYYTTQGDRRYEETHLPGAFGAPEADRKAREQEAEARDAATVALARKAPLLHGGAFEVVDKCFTDLCTSQSGDASMDVMLRLETEIAPWIPPLEPVRAPGKPAPSVGLWPIAFLMLWAAVLYALFAR